MTFGGSGPHNPNSNDMHPDDRRNLIIFILIAVVIYFAFDHFVMQPQVMAMRAAQLQAQQEKTLAAGSGEQPAPAPETRDDVVAAGARLPIDNGAIFGTLPLTGNRIDDIQLSHYVRTLHGSDHVPVLIPAGTAHPKFAEIGWVAEDGSVPVPGKDTRWSVSAGEKLSMDHPVTMTWSNGQGLTFQKTIAIDDHYALSVKQSVTNTGARSVRLYPYALVAGIGIPEGFSKQPIAHEGPIGYIGDKLHEITYKELDEKGEQGYSAGKGWTGITEKYWLVSLIPQQNEISKYRFTRTPSASGQSRYQADIRGDVRDIAPGASAESLTHLFAGAKEIRLLDAYEKKYDVPHFDLAVDFGLYYFLTKPFFYLLSFLGKVTGNFGIAIIIFTFMLRLAMFPLNNTSYRSFAKLKKIAPEMSALREKYSGDKQKLQHELVALYGREKVNPAAGCLPILLQIPIFFALYKVLSVTIEMRHAPFFGWIHDLSAMDPTTIFNLFGLIDWTPPPPLMIGAWPILMMLAMLVQRRMNPPPQDPIQAKMVAYMPYFLTFIMAKFAAGLVIYWTVSNTLSVIQQYVIMKSMGVEVKFFHKSKIEEKLEKQVKSGPSVHPEIEMIEEQVEDALTDESAVTRVSAPKPRKKKKK
jgi:YidC/Oxa1 family membrane protein insertase